MNYKKSAVFVVALGLLIAILSSSTAILDAKTPFEVDTVNVKSVSTSVTTTASEVFNSIKDKLKKANGKAVKGTVRADVLNVRTGPWNDIIGTLTKGATVNITGSLGDWYEIEYNGKKSYVHSKWVDVDGVKRDSPDGGVVSDCYWLNVRRAPGGDILGQIEAGTKVEILGAAGDWYKIKYNGNEAFVSKRYIDTGSSSTKSTGTSSGSGSSTFKEFNGYVNSSIGLNVRDGVWGNIVAAVPNGTQLKVVGKSGDWYIVEYKGVKRYVHANYISTGSSSVATATKSAGVATAASGNLQKNIVNSAKALVGSTKFRGPEVAYGNLACAQVVTTALKNAGALSQVHLNCRSTISDLKSKGWKEVKVPPFQEGDVITWKTYDYTGDGIKDDDTHIGIIVKEGNTYKAMNNSSSLRTPRMSDPYAIGPVSRVLRKV